MAEITPLEPGNPYAGGITDQVFSAMTEENTVPITGREIFIFKTSDDLAASIVITSEPSAKTLREGDITLAIAAGAGNHAIWGPSPLDGFAVAGVITIPLVSNGLMMVIRPPQ